MSLVLGKVVCITGASRGIGRATALEFAKHGATGFVLHYYGDEATRKEVLTLEEEIKSISDACRSVAVPGDIANRETSLKIVQEGIQKFGRIDVLVSNVGICPFSDFLTMPIETWDRTRQVNLDGSFYIVQGVAKQMKQQEPQGGAIICVSSISALVGGEQQCHYTPTKAALLSLMQSCAVALGKYNIRCNAVLPGTIATDINAVDLSDPVKRENMIKRTVLGRLGVPEDVAGPIVFLASDLARYVTGASVLVDGGLFVNLQ
ncbi:NAD-binding protein [Fomitiporia mediterranea MF3/22]|uniref:NAD-binding protein n=1 Tax=Fomitiporia mediterranea (strain MF3/22) TaxID=694068 RepID=UPI00044096C8|nr:NAD-binding protein [Fomitiporia mediterranea MF3/22]EJD04102.1 NAD-binding protein [Fomitiporia mediterranea MF3/22]